MIEEVGTTVQFLPPYSPDLNPISKVKSELKCLKDGIDHSDIEVLTLTAFASVTPQDCKGWISHCNINSTYIIIDTALIV